MIPSCAIVGTAGSAGGGGSPTITLTNTTCSDAVTGGTATATYQVDSNGKIYKNSVFFENWISDAALAGDYQVRATLSSGDTPSGTLGSWLALTSDRYWDLINAAQDDSTLSCALIVEIRDAATSTVRATATITISATSRSVA
jgi:hypothetical protein